MTSDRFRDRFLVLNLIMSKISYARVFNLEVTFVEGTKALLLQCGDQIQFRGAFTELIRVHPPALLALVHILRSYA